MSALVHACVRLCLCIGARLCVCLCVHVHVHVHVHLCTCMGMCGCVQVCMYVYICMYVCMNVCMYDYYIAVSVKTLASFEDDERLYCPMQGSVGSSTGKARNIHHLHSLIQQRAI